MPEAIEAVEVGCKSRLVHSMFSLAWPSSRVVFITGLGGEDEEGEKNKDYYKY